ncbi:MAG: osmoprotectant transport system substrate-binding protein [Gaiellaceae bacterium]|nr:osmoprotectant transport system substrate-binding protein [Gaiellaceae bacterium]
MFKAVIATALGIAVLTGGAAQAAQQKPAALPTVTIGTKNFTEQYVLGQLYKQALESKGYKVVYKEDIGNSELIDTALTSGKINFYPEYTGVIVADLAKKPAPKSADAAYAAAKKFEEGRGNTLLAKTPFFDSDSFGMLASTAKKLGVKTIDDMKKVKSFTFGGFPECRTRITCLLGLTKTYGLKQTKFVPLASISVYTALDQGKITAGDVFSTDPQLAGSKYTVLTDTKHIFGFQNVAPVISQKLAKDGGAKFAATINAVSAKLSLKAMIAMNKAVAIDKKSPETVASAFLTANKLK